MIIRSPAVEAEVVRVVEQPPGGRAGEDAGRRGRHRPQRACRRARSASTSGPPARTRRRRPTARRRRPAPAPTAGTPCSPRRTASSRRRAATVRARATSAAKPSDAVATVMPSRRARRARRADRRRPWRTRSPRRRPRGHGCRRCGARPRPRPASRRAPASTNSARASRGGNGEIEPGGRTRPSGAGALEQPGLASRTCMVSKIPSPRRAPRSSARRIGVSAGTTPRPRTATRRSGSATLWSGTRRRQRDRTPGEPIRPDVGSSVSDSHWPTCSARGAAADRAAPARPRGRLRARPRDARPGAREGQRDRGRGQHHHRLPHARAARGARPGHARPPVARRADVPRGREEQHVHLVCRRCQAIEEVPSAMLNQLAATLGAERGFQIDVGHVALFGCVPAAATIETTAVSDIQADPRRLRMSAVRSATSNRRRRDAALAAHYGDPMREQRALDRDVALVDRSNRGVIAITGPERLTWLHNITTQHLLDLAPGRGHRAAGAVAARARRARTRCSSTTARPRGSTSSRARPPLCSSSC